MEVEPWIEFERVVLCLGAMGHCRRGKLGSAAELGSRACVRLLAQPTRA